MPGLRRYALLADPVPLPGKLGQASYMSACRLCSIIASPTQSCLLAVVLSPSRPAHRRCHSGRAGGL
eukprot:5718344-Alexandrium_andersonii.AAC.1